MPGRCSCTPHLESWKGSELSWFVGALRMAAYATATEPAAVFGRSRAVLVLLMSRVRPLDRPGGKRGRLPLRRVSRQTCFAIPAVDSKRSRSSSDSIHA